MQSGAYPVCIKIRTSLVAISIFCLCGVALGLLLFPNLVMLFYPVTRNRALATDVRCLLHSLG
jgi:hypothetical protein